MESHLKVLLVSHTPDPEQAVTAAARLCYSSAGIEEVVAAAEKEDRRKFLEKLTDVGHLSPVEHTSFTFAIEGISRACSHQLVRHRLASYSQQSQRYVSEEGGFAYIMPPSIREDSELAAHFEGLMEKIQSSYDFLFRKLASRGLSRESAAEDARFVLPNAKETKIMMTMNARELLHFFSQRLCNRAQWEIREMALAMLRLVKPIAPVIFRDAGPPCLRGACPEGPRSCGKTQEVRAFFRDTDGKEKRPKTRRRKNENL